MRFKSTAFSISAMLPARRCRRTLAFRGGGNPENSGKAFEEIPLHRAVGICFVLKSREKAPGSFPKPGRRRCGCPGRERRWCSRSGRRRGDTSFYLRFGAGPDFGGRFLRWPRHICDTGRMDKVQTERVNFELLHGSALLSVAFTRLILIHFRRPV